MLLVLQAKCSINKKHKWLYLLQSAVMTVCTYILRCIIFVILVTWNILKGGWGASPVQNNFFFLYGFIYINCLSRCGKKKNFYYSCPLQQLGKDIHPRSVHMFSHYTPGYFFFLNMDKSMFYMPSCECIIFKHRLLLQIWNLNFMVSSTMIICYSLFQALITYVQNGSHAYFLKMLLPMTW